MATYTVVAVSRTPAQATGPTLVELGPIAGNVTYTDVLKEASTASISVDTDSLGVNVKERLRDLIGYPMEIWVYRDSDLVFAGPVLGGNISESVLTLDARGLELYTAYMLITTDKSWSAVDVATICKTVIDDWQDLDYGDYGIETALTGTAGLTRTMSAPGATEPIVVYDFLVEQSVDFDWWVDPSTRGLEVAAARGSDLSSTIFLERGVVSPAIRFGVSPLAIASDLVAIGTSPDIDGALTTTKANTALRSSFGRAGGIFTADPVRDATHLSELAQATIDQRATTLFVPGPGLMPIVGADVDDFGVGDTITYTFDAGLGQQTGTYRIVKRTITVAESGQETMAVEFGVT